MQIRVPRGFLISITDYCKDEHIKLSSFARNLLIRAYADIVTRNQGATKEQKEHAKAIAAREKFEIAKEIARHEYTASMLVPMTITPLFSEMKSNHRITHRLVSSQRAFWIRAVAIFGANKEDRSRMSRMFRMLLTKRGRVDFYEFYEKQARLEHISVLKLHDKNDLSSFCVRKADEFFTKQRIKNNIPIVAKVKEEPVSVEEESVK